MSTLEIAKNLIARPSITPNDGDCQSFIAQYLQDLGFQIRHLPYGDVKNLWAIRGTGIETNQGNRDNRGLNQDPNYEPQHEPSHDPNHPILAFAGHTDVVPIGKKEDWVSDPFTPTLRDGFLYGRGAADMKGSIAAMLTACKRFLAHHPNHKGTIAFLITSDEEGEAQDGTAKVVEYLKKQQIHLNYCIVGEPSSRERLADVIKIGRRGSIGCHLKILGKQGHVAYPHKADNPIHRALGALQKLVAFTWDQGNENFPPTILQISNIKAGTGATNVIPGHLECDFTLRFSSEISVDFIKAQVQKILDEDCQYECHWRVHGLPFLTKSGKLLSATQAAIQKVLNIVPELSTDGGTSDGRFIATLGTEVLELGPCNHTIHQVNECVGIEELDQLSVLYEEILKNLFT